MYTAGEENVHRVLPVCSGERFTLAMWFTRDAAFEEDVTLLPKLEAACCSVSPQCGSLPDTMYQQRKESEASAPEYDDIRLDTLKEMGLMVCVEGTRGIELTTSSGRLPWLAFGNGAAAGRCKLSMTAGMKQWQQS
eukprot:jgi/Chlat1/4065/Chrsp26S08847